MGLITYRVALIFLLILTALIFLSSLLLLRLYYSPKFQKRVQQQQAKASTLEDDEDEEYKAFIKRQHEEAMKQQQAQEFTEQQRAALAQQAAKIRAQEARDAEQASRLKFAQFGGGDDSEEDEADNAPQTPATSVKEDVQQQQEEVEKVDNTELEDKESVLLQNANAKEPKEGVLGNDADKDDSFTKVEIPSNTAATGQQENKTNVNSNDTTDQVRGEAEPVVQKSSPAQEEPSVKPEPSPKPSKEIIMCRNTVQGHSTITDSRGYTCDVDDLDPFTQCCKKSIARYSCESCNKHQCCSVYEYCVSCCMSPENRADLKSVFEKKKKEHQLYKNLQTVFQFCSTRCRTSSKSIINMNKYRTKYKHCYGMHDPSDIQHSHDL